MQKPSKLALDKRYEFFFIDYLIFIIEIFIDIKMIFLMETYFMFYFLIQIIKIIAQPSKNIRE